MIARKPSPLLTTALLTALGLVLAFWLFGVEQQAMRDSIAGREEQASRLHLLRPWALALLPLLPAAGAFLYLLGDRIDRYLGRQFLKVFGGTIATLLAIWLIGDFNNHADDFGQSEQLGTVAINYYFSQAPAILVLMLPYALLISLLYLLGSLSKSCEIVSILQTGRSLPRLALPFLSLGLLCSMACMIFNFHWAPQAARYHEAILKGVKVDKAGRSGASNIVYNNEETQRIWRAGFLPSDYQESSPLEEVSVESFAKPGVLRSVLSAREAHFAPESGTWTFDGAVLMDYQVSPPSSQALEGPYTIADFPETPWQMLNPTLQPEQRGMPSLSERLSSPRIGSNEQTRLETQWYLRMANSLTCLIVVAIALPLGIVFTRRGTATGVATAVFIAAAMIFSAQVIPAFSEAGYLSPALGAFGANLIFGILALLLINRRIKGQPIYAQLRSLIGIRA